MAILVTWLTALAVFGYTSSSALELVAEEYEISSALAHPRYLGCSPSSTSCKDALGCCKKFGSSKAFLTCVSENGCHPSCPGPPGHPSYLGYLYRPTCSQAAVCCAFSPSSLEYAYCCSKFGCCPSCQTSPSACTTLDACKSLGGTCKKTCDANEVAKNTGCGSGGGGSGGHSREIKEEEEEEEEDEDVVNKLLRGRGHGGHGGHGGGGGGRPSKPTCKCCIPGTVVVTPNCTAAAACCSKVPGTPEFYQCCTQYQCCPVCPKETCCFGDKEYQTGETIGDIPQLCQTYVCQRLTISVAPYFQMAIAPVPYDCPYCVYENKTYAVGSTIATFPDECYELKCEADSAGDPAIVLNSIPCTKCQYESLLFSVGQVIATFAEECKQLVCNTGSNGVPEISVQPFPCDYCIYQNATYDIGEVIESFPEECHELMCLSDGAGGSVITLNDTLCDYCQYNGSIFSDGEVIAVFPEYCSLLVCNVSSDGPNITLQVIVPCDYCLYDGSSYENGSIVALYPSECQALICQTGNDDVPDLTLISTPCPYCEFNGTRYNVSQDIYYCPEGCRKLVCEADAFGVAYVSETDIENCTQCFHEGKTYNVGDVVATYPEDCVQLVCAMDEATGKAAVTVKGAGCGCCALGDKLYADQELLTSSNHCVAVQCVGGNWTNRNFFSANCRACRIGNNLLLFQTFDLAAYVYGESECTYELVNLNGQNVITVDFQPAYTHESFTFTDTGAATVNCPASDPLNACSFGPVTTTPTEINSQGTLAYAMTLGGITYTAVDGTNGITVLYNNDTMFVFAHESVKGELDGLCGNYNGNSTDEYITSTGTNANNTQEFASSYSAGGSNCTLRDLLDLLKHQPEPETDFCEEPDDRNLYYSEDNDTLEACEEQATNAMLEAHNETESSENLMESEDYDEALTTCLKTMCACPANLQTDCLASSNLLNEEMMKIKARTRTPDELEDMFHTFL